jgi:hypothetical protein
MRFSTNQSDLMACTRKHCTVKTAYSTSANDDDMFEVVVQINSLVRLIQMILVTNINRYLTIITL